MSNQEVAAQVTERMIAALEKGTIPWQTPWNAAFGRPMSMSSRKPYNGINVWLLGLADYSSPWWGTYRQISESGGQVRKGEKSTHVVLFKPVTRTDKTTGDETSFFIARFYSVFNAEQADGLPKKFYPSADAPESLPELSEPQGVLDAYIESESGPTLRHSHGDRAYCEPGADRITLPPLDQFKSSEHYYATAFHEAGHSTGHESRLARPGVLNFDHFGSERYAEEELAAQMTSSMLAASTGILNDSLFDNSAAYVNNWLAKLKDDHGLFMHAASQAQKATDMIMNASA